jgi:hypothetical protein
MEIQTEIFKDCNALWFNVIGSPLTYNNKIIGKIIKITDEESKLWVTMEIDKDNQELIRNLIEKKTTCSFEGE